MATLTFDGAVNTAVTLARQQFGEISLLFATGTPSSGAARTATDIDRLCVTCLAPNNRTAVFASTQWGEFAPPTIVDHPILGALPIAWPIQFDLPDAIEILRREGYEEPFTSVTLNQPLYPGVEQPAFVFQFADGSCVIIGCNDHQVNAISPSTIAVA